MATRLNLGICNDHRVLYFANMLKTNKIQAGENIKVKTKNYFISPNLIVTRDYKDNLGEVYKFYKKGFGDESWYLKNRQVINERGSYMRGINLTNKEIRNVISLGGQDCFVKQTDGSYLQKGFDKYKDVKATAEEIEKAIDYIKGKGSIENYQKLLRK